MRAEPERQLRAVRRRVAYAAAAPIVARQAAPPSKPVAGVPEPVEARLPESPPSLPPTVPAGLDEPPPVSAPPPPVLLGFWAARRRLLERPQDHLPLLRRTAVIGIAVGWLGGLPSALAHLGALDVPADALAEDGALPSIQEATGIAAGLGYVAVFGLLAHRISVRAGRERRSRRHRVTRAVAALGKRSLSGYLGHSLLFSPVLAAWGLGLGRHLSSASMAAFAVGVWLVTVLAADALERAGRQGPAEAVMRRLVYRRPTTPR